MGFGLRELWRFRELLVFLAWRDLKVRYKQTLLGVVWAVLQPLLYTFVATLIFKRLLDVYSVGALRAAGALRVRVLAPVRERGHARVQQPRRQRVAAHEGLLPAPARAARARSSRRGVDLALSTGLLLVVMAAYGYFPDPAARVGRRSPPCSSPQRPRSGSASWLAALNVKYRDIRFVVPFVLQLWLFGSSVFITFDALNLSEPWATLYWLNPMAGAVEAFRWAMLGGVRPEVAHLAISGCMSLVLFVAGVIFFRRKEREFADIV